MCVSKGLVRRSGGERIEREGVFTESGMSRTGGRKDVMEGKGASSEEGSDVPDPINAIALSKNVQGSTKLSPVDHRLTLSSGIDRLTSMSSDTIKGSNDKKKVIDARNLKDWTKVYHAKIENLTKEENQVFLSRQFYASLKCRFR